MGNRDLCIKNIDIVCHDPICPYVMKNHSDSLFHAEITFYLLKNRAFEKGANFQETLEEYHRLLSQNLNLEQSLLDVLPLKILRGLPRLFKNSSPSISHIKKEFSHLPSLKSLAIEKYLLPFYENFQASPETKVCLFTYMLSDGWGDLIAHKEIFKILQKRFPKISIQSVVCIPKGFSFSDPTTLIIPYDIDCPITQFSKVALHAIQSADLVLSVPTYYPHINELKKIAPKTSFVSLGQYGFIESSDFHPKSGNISMGLHFLEKGILTRESREKGDFRLIENQTLLYTLFGTATPQTVDIEIYQAAHKFYLAYLVSPIGGAVYLHALLHSQRQSLLDIDICSPDIGWLIGFIEIQQKENKPILEGNWGIQELEIHFGGKIHRREVAKQGKKVRIICPGPLSDTDFRKLLRLSEEFVAVRGDQSFSECICANRLFFYDGAPHARYFMKDLLAIAENKLSHNKPALSLFRAMGAAFAYNIAEETNEWVEDTYFQEKVPLENIAKSISIALASPETLAGFKQFNQIIAQEYSCNETICQIVARELSHRLFPEKARKEKAEIQAFAEGKQSLNETLERLNAKAQNKLLV